MNTLKGIELAEALKDSPRFRWELHQHETYFRKLDTKLREIVRLCAIMIDFGKSYVGAFYNMVDAMSDINNECFSTDPSMCSAFGIVTMALREVVKIEKLLVEQAHWSVMRNLQDFLQKDLHKVFDTRQHFDKLSASLDESLARSAAVSRSAAVDATASNGEQRSEGNDGPAADVRGETTAIATCFAHTALDYAFLINVTHHKKNAEILKSLQSFVDACCSAFGEGRELFVAEHWARDVEYVRKAICDFESGARRAEIKMQDRHTLVPKELYRVPFGMSPEPGAVMEGYLFKRATNAFRTWHRRFFVIKNGKLMYRHRDEPPVSLGNVLTTKLTDEGYTVMEGDLRVCLVRPAPASVDRQYCLELVTPSKTHLLQADSEALCDAWIKALRRTIESAIGDHDHGDTFTGAPLAQPFDRRSIASTASSDEHRSDAVNSARQQPHMSSGPPSRPSPATKRKPTGAIELARVPGNEQCADCSKANPQWASVNLGVTLCIECAGIHRSLGVQVSKVRSLTLDVWEPVHVALMKRLGNTAVNAAYLAHLPEDPVPPAARPDAGRPVRAAWIHAKYVERRFAAPVAQRLVHAAYIRATRGPPHHNPASRLSSGGGPRSKSAPEHAAAARLAHGGVKLRPPSPLRVAVASQRALLCRSNPCLLDDLTEAVEGQPVSRNLSSCGSEGALDILNEIEADELLGQSADGSETRPSDQKLVRAARAGNLADMVSALAAGADINVHVAESTGAHAHTTALHQTMIAGSAEASELLLLNGAKANVVDGEARTPLHLACAQGNTAHVCQLLKRAAMHDLKDGAGHTPLDIAVENRNADIVTLLRLWNLRDEVGRSGESALLSSHMDDTMQSVLDDLSAADAIAR